MFYTKEEYETAVKFNIHIHRVLPVDRPTV